MKYSIVAILIIFSSQLFAQITVDNYDLTIESELDDTLQSIYENFLNEQVEKISIISLKKKYDDYEYYNFLKHKKFFQSRKKWIKRHSYEQSIIRERYASNLEHVDSVIFTRKFLGVDSEFIGAEHFLDSTETKMALKEMFNGKERSIVDMCYIPRHAILFYNANDDIVGIYEICFECKNVKIGIIGTKKFSKYSPFIKSLFLKYNEEL
jgi:hypothetical protein